jgi:hypothetical protein
MADQEEKYPFGLYNIEQSIDEDTGESSFVETPMPLQKYETSYIPPPMMNPSDKITITVPEEIMEIVPTSSIFIDGYLISNSEYTILNNIVTLENAPQANAAIIIIK